ncbi:TlpA disulfide reductase family protein [Pedobacter sp. Hv1]|uniref:TlpA family protein disulfide reductase n=1 Tax=Pedobacter sp. Hv1 TaxID=1740090 RepID=UPI0006D89C6A|nr:TlpA disulfide reductase family protein [Pedobacter sp. Hv1]KQC02776.1 hypothetical protein AQF98_04160 [Pedobacter sp. Hv1]
MKKISLITLFCIIAFQAIAQQKIKISGKLLNCTDRILELMPSTGNFKDSVLINTDGTFTYETTAIQTPFRANLTNRKQIQIQLFLAPGYDLQLQADVKDNATSRSTLTYTGIGSKTNAYWKEILANFKADTVKWRLKTPDVYINHLLSNNKNTTLIDKVFNSSNKEPYSAYFKKSLLIDKKYGTFLSIYNSYAYENNYKWEQITQMAAQLGFKPLMSELNNADNLSSNAFSYFVNEYPFYCDIYNAFPADSLIKKSGNYSLYLASKFYTGRVYDYVASKKIESTLSSIYKLGDFQKLQPYIDKISDPALKKSILKIGAARVKEAMKLQAGAPSPTFNLPDTSGVLHNLASFKGKVVYIDLWASWCGPCKEETPYLKKIVDRYKGNDKIEIISIAAFDAKNRERRYGIIKKDQMSWLQLEDTNDSFAKSYQANFIPRFIIIDKQGNIVDSDAVRPSEPEKLMAILNQEINK